jgi:PAS domain S-box-containing protein
LDYTGQRLEEAIGWGWTQAIHPDDQEASARSYGQAVEDRTVLRQEHRIRRHDGSYRWFVVSASPLQDQTGQVVKMYGAATDIDEIKRLEATLLEADRRKDEFLAMLAHELRNPLAPIRNGLQLLAQTNAQDQTLSALLPIMNRQMDHLMHMVDDLLDVSRISRGKIELHKQRIDLVQVVDQIVRAMQPLYAASGRQLSAHLSDSPLYLDGDGTRLNQVVANLLSNGLRYTHKGGQVRLSLERLGEQALLRVSDNGIGLAADQLDAIFELFVQVDNSLARSHGGLGLGLALVQQLVQLHGGRVEAHSRGLKQGSEFVVYLPILFT